MSSRGSRLHKGRHNQLDGADNGQLDSAPSLAAIKFFRRAGNLILLGGLGAGATLGLPVVGFVGLLIGLSLRSSAAKTQRFRKQLLAARPDEVLRFRGLVAEVSRSAGITPPQHVLVISAPSPNAAATRLGRRGKGTIFATDSLLRILNTSELRAVVAHELSHLQHADSRYVLVPWLPATVINAVRNFIPFAAGWGAVAAAGASLSLLWAPPLAFFAAFATVKYASYLGASLVAHTAQNSLRRSLESRADRNAAALTDGAALASGLRRIAVHSQEVSGGLGTRRKLLGVDPDKKPNLAQRAVAFVAADHPSTWARRRALLSQSASSRGVE